MAASSMPAILAFRAHPDDEVLLAGGTLARLAAEGHRVTVGVACDVVMGAASGAGGGARLDELRVRCGGVRCRARRASGLCRQFVEDAARPVSTTNGDILQTAQ
jgi:LmbE family N-acetylglucosaminyl deacetylase